MFKLLKKFTLFYSHFQKFLPNFSSMLLKFVEIFQNSVFDIIFKEKHALLIVLI